MKVTIATLNVDRKYKNVGTFILEEFEVPDETPRDDIGLMCFLIHKGKISKPQDCFRTYVVDRGK